MTPEPVSPADPGDGDRRPGERAAFVGRREQLAILDNLWTSALSAVPTGVVIEGPAGIGKSALVRCFVASSGAVTLAATADPDETNVPYGTMQQILSSAVSPGRDPLAVGADLLDHVGSSQESGGVVVFVDDVQWMDTPSLRALLFAFRRLRADRVLAVLVCRDDEAPPPVQRLIDTGGAVHLRLAGLTNEELQELARGLGRTTTPRGLRALWEHTGGSPLYARALLRELDDEVLADAASRPFPAPRSFARLVQARVAACSVATEALLAAAAVLGQRVRLMDAAVLAGLPDPSVALDQAVDEELLVPVAGTVPLEVAFDHPLVRSAIYHDLSPARLSHLHLAAAERTQGVAEIEHRVAGALTEDPRLADALAGHARDEAAAGSYAAAAAHLGAAAELVTDVAARDQFRSSAAQLWLAAGDVEEAVATFGASRGEVTASGMCVSGQLALATGRLGDAERPLLRAWEQAQVEGQDEVATLAAIALGHVYLFWQRYADAAAWAQRAIELGSGTPLTATAHGVRLVGLLPSAGEDAVVRAAAWLPESVEDPTPVQVEGQLGRGIAWLWAGRLDDAYRDLAAVADTSRSWRPLRARILALGYLAETEYRLGRWDESIAHGVLGTSLGEDADQRWLLAFSHAQTVAALAARGRFDDARHHAETAQAAAKTLGDDANAAFAVVARAHVAHAQGDRDLVVEALWPLLTAGVREGIDEPGFFPWRELLAGALLDLGRLDDAEEVLEPFEELARAAKGDLDGALADFEHAGAQAATAAMPFEQARVHDDHGRTLRRAGRRRDAAERLTVSLRHYEQLGAVPFIDSCRRELTACGVRQRSPSVRQGIDLTPQELAVAQLVLTGRRNRDIATELVVSIKTVEYHLGNLYMKLGVPSRAELIARHASGDLVLHDASAS